MMTRVASFKFAALCCCFLALAACSRQLQPDLDAGLNNSAGAGMAAPGSKADFTANIGDRVLFAEDHTELSAEATATLVKQADWLKQYARVNIQIEGHADERGTREYNIALSARRATNVRNFLIQQGIAGERISSIAYGKERPVALCDSEKCWSQNRRAVTVITGGTN